MQTHPGEGDGLGQGNGRVALGPAGLQRTRKTCRCPNYQDSLAGRMFQTDGLPPRSATQGIRLRRLYDEVSVPSKSER